MAPIDIWFCLWARGLENNTGGLWPFGPAWKVWIWPCIKAESCIFFHASRTDRNVFFYIHQSDDQGTICLKKGKVLSYYPNLWSPWDFRAVPSDVVGCLVTSMPGFCSVLQQLQTISALETIQTFRLLDKENWSRKRLPEGISEQLDTCRWKEWVVVFWESVLCIPLQ